MIERLTPRETEVLGLIARGLTNNEIAQVLFVSVNTVQKHHVPTILGKLGARNRTEAAVMAIKKGLIDVAGQAEI